MLIYKDIEKRLLSCEHKEQNNQETKLETINPETWLFLYVGGRDQETTKLFQQS